MTHLKQHVFNSATDVCIYCGAERQEEHLPCDHALDSAPDYFDREDPRWQAEESENALKPEFGMASQFPLKRSRPRCVKQESMIWCKQREGDDIPRKFGKRRNNHGKQRR